jgi:hypothetical protein
MMGKAPSPQLAMGPNIAGPAMVRFWACRVSDNISRSGNRQQVAWLGSIIGRFGLDGKSNGLVSEVEYISTSWAT